MKLLFNWHIRFEHRYFKSRRNEYRLRIWREIKYRHIKKEKPVALGLYLDATVPIITATISSEEITISEETK